MLTFEVIIVFLGLIGMVTALLLDKMRPGMILFSVGTFIKYYKISQLIHTQIIAN